ncbi:uncharacterized protein LAESUDRAFT_730502 [Laetiporus sulphureus 93-53]|uniref:Alpha-ketoglutarate-dependent dioxygenase AlkB-like domain-containing protein n=1 Tax=Laetiporus sulphureus 93-53 TaxID=1314785 RepID=A0A165C3Z0_9APHY|nr:uncharacterized protein LAESUDRAFT_730502 [Laetiporus sulphureus 93-53]KZT02163.1 hypothetical protein LAESUDRAFT_730502 [Laetiporus sulphureus 93-53]
MGTDLLLAMLASLVDQSKLYEQEALLEALLACDGNVEEAAALIARRKGKNSENTNGKRKRRAVLDEWLGTSRAETDTSNAMRSTFKSRSSAPRASPTMDETNFSSSSRKSSLSARAYREASSPNASTSESTGSSAAVRKLDRSPESPSKARAPTTRLPPLILGTPALVAQHTPCTLHLSILPPELACRLFHTMWLFDRVVESPHRTSFSTRRSSNQAEDDENMQQAAQYWYNGRRTEPPATFLPAREEACVHIERVVNREMRKRKRFPLEWGGEPGTQKETGSGEKILWRANVAAANCYEGAKESVGFHSNQLTYLGPYATIASLSLEVVPTDERETRSARTYDIPLSHNSLIIMHASTQETFKHSVPPQSVIDLFHPPFPPPPDFSAPDERKQRSTASPSNCRINMTSRFYPPDFRAQATLRCNCGVPCILRPDMKNRYRKPSETSGHGEGLNHVTVDEGTGHPLRKNMVDKYWWTCYAGAQNDGKGCGFWKVMDDPLCSMPRTSS